MEKKIKHLEFIQSSIDRMAGNLFFLKGWTITLVSALFALSAKDAKPEYMLIAYFTVLIFWVLDGYFLSRERLFRDLYDEVRNKDEEEIDFSMNTEKFKVYYRNSRISAMCSSTLLWFYPPLIAAMAAVMFLTK